ncbi:MAG: HAMP domain-containing protein [Candidatus Rokubacteria bacterium]|nr:HAMP domain-containing protein [Candidatus Rokubacteria bacterium]
MLRRKTLRSRLFWALASALAVLVVIVSIVWRLTVEPALRQAVAAHHQEVAGRAADQIQEFMDHQIAELTAATELGRLWRERPGSQKEILYRLLKLAPTVQEVRLADAGGRVVSRLARHRVYTGADLGASVEADPGFRRAVAGEVYVGDVFHGATAEPMVRVGVPIKFTATDIRGVLLAEINLKTLWDPIADLTVGRGGSAFVVDRVGRLIAHRDYSRVLLGVSLADHPAFRLARAGARDNGRVIEGGRRPSDGAGVISAFAIVPRTGWVVIIEEPEATALAGVSRVKRIATALIFVALVGSFGLSYWFSARIARPIRQLQEGAARISRGDLRHRLEITASHEIEALAREFNEMAEQLRLSREGLERKVAEKTRDLSALYALVTPLSPTGHLEETLDAALAKITEMTGADGGLIRISGPDRAEVLETSHPPSLKGALKEAAGAGRAPVGRPAAPHGRRQERRRRDPGQPPGDRVRAPPAGVLRGHLPADRDGRGERPPVHGDAASA